MPDCGRSLLDNLSSIRARLARLDVAQLARRTGLQRRKPRQLSAAEFLLVITALAPCGLPTLERIAAAARLLTGRSFSKQAAGKRLTGRIDQFLAAVIAALFGGHEKAVLTGAALTPFPRVLVQDSTTIALPAKFAASFPGAANQRRAVQAALKIQLICDLAHGTVQHLSLSSFRRNDQAAAPDILAVAQPGDLVLRDLGFFVLASFQALQANGVFFLSRWRTGINLLDPDTQAPLDLVGLLRRQRTRDRQVWLGQEERLPVRLVAVPVPDTVANSRRRKAKTNRDRRLNPSPRHLFLMGWNIFVTNVGPDTWKPAQLLTVYALRWRIEMTFKACKSHLGLCKLNGGSEAMLRRCVMSTLIFGALTHSACTTLAAGSGTLAQVSLLRLARLLHDAGLLIAATLLNLEPSRLLDHWLRAHAFYEQRPDRVNFYAKLLAAT